jgi:outer membrane protein assembly factor BamB
MPTHRCLVRHGALIGALVLAGPLHATDWPQFGFDAAHSGSNPAETTLGAANVVQLTPRFPGGATLAATVDSAPVYQAGVATAGGTKNLLFMLATNGRVMAIDAATGSEVWAQPTSGKVPATASPALDPGRQYVYSYGLDGKAHKYRVGDGVETTGGGWPQTITLKTNVEKGASGLTIASSGGTNHLLVVTDGYIGDAGDYQGHLVSIDLASGAQAVFNAMCSDQSVHLATNACAGLRSGIWGRGGATFVASTNRVYIATGNGNFNASSGGMNWGDSVLALAPDGSGSGQGLPLDSYTPANYQALDDTDTDLGSTSPAVLPAPPGSTVRNLGLQVGKDAQLRLLDLADLGATGVVFANGFEGGRRAVHTGGELQLLAVPQGGSGMREQPAVWSNPADGTAWVFVGNARGLSGLQLGLDANHKPMLTARWTQSAATTSPVVANGVLYSAGTCAAGTCVIARNPLSGAVLWTSPAIGGVHWQSPIVVDGALYITDQNAKLWKFALN